MIDNTKNIREAVGVFENDQKLQAAIDDLSLSRFERYEISVLGSEDAIKEKFNIDSIDLKELADNPVTPRGTNIAPEEIEVAQRIIVGGGMLVGVVTAVIAAGGVLLSKTIPAAIIGVAAGSVIGSVLAKLFGSAYAENLQKKIDKGGLILWVITSSKEKEGVACKILKKHGAKYVHVHDIDLKALNQ